MKKKRWLIVLASILICILFLCSYDFFPKGKYAMILFYDYDPNGIRIFRSYADDPVIAQRVGELVLKPLVGEERLSLLTEVSVKEYFSYEWEITWCSDDPENREVIMCHMGRANGRISAIYINGEIEHKYGFKKYANNADTARALGDLALEFCIGEEAFGSLEEASVGYYWIDRKWVVKWRSTSDTEPTEYTCLIGRKTASIEVVWYQSGARTETD